MTEDDICMMCGRTADETATESDGTFWTYCRPCDCWTDHGTNTTPDDVRAEDGG